MAHPLQPGDLKDSESIYIVANSVIIFSYSKYSFNSIRCSLRFIKFWKIDNFSDKASNLPQDALADAFDNIDEADCSDWILTNMVKYYKMKVVFI